MKKLKIGMLTEIINSHSGARAPLEIAKYLSRLGHEVTLYGQPHKLDAATLADLKKNKVNIEIIPKKDSTLISEVRSSLFLFKALKSHKLQILTFSGRPPFFLAGKLTGIPIVRIYQGTQFDALLETKIPGERVNLFEILLNKLANVLIYLIDFMSYRMSSGIVAISKFCADEGNQLYKRRVDAVIYHGTTKFPQTGLKKKKKNSVQIVTVSRITPYKGFHLIIEALKKVKTDKKFVLRIIGSQPKKEYLKYLKKIGGDLLQVELDVSDTNLSKIYQESNIYANADRYLYFGLPITEAGLFQIPTVSLNLAAANELVVNGKTGLIAQNMEEFALSFQNLIQNNNLTRKMGLEAQKRALSVFTWEKTALEYTKLFEKILARK